MNAHARDWPEALETNRKRILGTPNALDLGENFGVGEAGPHLAPIDRDPPDDLGRYRHDIRIRERYVVTLTPAFIGLVRNSDRFLICSFSTPMFQPVSV